MLDALAVQNGNVFEAVFSDFASKIINTDFGNLWNYLADSFGTQFRNVGLADRVSISEDYGTRSLYGIGEPTDPALVPNNVSVRISISRLTLDGRSIADYTTKPSFWYNSGLQNSLLSLASGIPVIGSAGADYAFYTYLAIGDLENNRDLPVQQLYNNIINYPIYAFIPRSFSKQISSGDSVIMTDVEGEGKVFRLKKLVEIITNRRAGRAR